MNWKQIYNSLPSEERLATTLLILHALEKHQQKFIFTGTRIVRDRRRVLPPAHYVRDRRRPPTPLRRRIHLSAFVFILTTFSVGVWTLATHIAPVYSAALIGFHLASFTSLLVLKPYPRPIPVTSD